MQCGVSFEVPQPQCFKNKHYLMPHLLKMEAACLSPATPALSALKMWLRERHRAEASGASSPLCQHQGPGARMLCNPVPTVAGKVGGVRTVSQPLSQVPEKTRESFFSCEQEEGTAGEGRSKKSSSAASSRTLPGNSY